MLDSWMSEPKIVESITIFNKNRDDSEHLRKMAYIDDCAMHRY